MNVLYFLLNFIRRRNSDGTHAFADISSPEILLKSLFTVVFLSLMLNIS